MRKIFLICLILCCSAICSAQKPGNFFTAFFNDSPDILSYVNETELARSERLGITYDGIANKFFNDYSLPPEVKNDYANAQITYESGEEGYETAILGYAPAGFSKRFYFKDNKLISPITYNSRNFTKLTSEYFNFLISDTTLFNEYSAKLLDRFADDMTKFMEFTPEEIVKLKQEKIIYILCRDENEIKDFIGTAAKGIYMVSMDAVISTYNCHFHEVSHLLMNYKIKNNIKPVPGFLLEGFAVTTGGRGGYKNMVMMDIGAYLLQSGLISLNHFPSNAEFFSEDASISYSVASLYNRFFVKTKGFEEYLNYYKAADSASQLLYEKEFREYIGNYKNTSIVAPAEIPLGSPVYKDKNIEIYKENLYYTFKTKQGLLFSEKTPVKNYQSKVFSEQLPSAGYNGEKYYIKVNDNTINMYNLYSNELTASLEKGFITNPAEFKDKDGYFIFKIDSFFFDESPETLAIKSE